MIEGDGGMLAMRPGRKCLMAVVLVGSLGLMLAPNSVVWAEETALRRAEITVGIDQGDFRGDDNRVLQAGVDYLANLGGGTLRIGPGRYAMRNALKLHDNIRVVGTPGKTVLVSRDSISSKLASTGGCNEFQISVDDPSGFRVGDGVSVQDNKMAFGFGVTTATITAQLDKNTFQIDNPLYFDYSVGREATARTSFPMIGLWNIKDCWIENIEIEGNREKTHYITGCRSGGIYLFRSDNVTIRNCVIRNYNGDGISFQVAQKITIENCVCENNAGVGIHPGSGSEYAVVRKNRSCENDGDGMFVCWRVRHGVFEGNDFSRNKRQGMSIGHKDTDNIFRNNVFAANTKEGILFRNQPASGGAHRNLFENNRIVDNGGCIVIKGHHHDLVFKNNTIGYTKPPKEPAAAIDTDANAVGLKAEDNKLLNVNQEAVAQTEKKPDERPEEK